MGDLFLKRKFLFRFSWVGGLRVGGGVVVAASIVKEIALLECEVTPTCVSLCQLLSAASCFSETQAEYDLDQCI